MTDDKQNSNEVSQKNEQQGVNKGNAPVETLRDGSLKLAIFQNQRETGTSYSTEPGRLYTDANGNIREAKSFSAVESLKMARLHEKAYDRISQIRQDAKANNRSNDRDRG